MDGFRHRLDVKKIPEIEGEGYKPDSLGRPTSGRLGDLGTSRLFRIEFFFLLVEMETNTMDILHYPFPPNSSIPPNLQH